MATARKALLPLEAWRVRVEQELEENTRITNEIRESQKHTQNAIAGLALKTNDVVDAYSQIQKGVRALDAIGRAWEWLVNKWKPILAAVIVGKLIFSGGSWTDAWNAGMKFLRHDQ